MNTRKATPYGETVAECGMLHSIQLNEHEYELIIDCLICPQFSASLIILPSSLKESYK